MRSTDVFRRVGYWTVGTSLATRCRMNLVLVGLDPSPNAAKVLDYAVRLVQRTGGKLVLARAVGIPIELPAQAFTLTPAELAPVLVGQAKKALEEQTKHIPAGLVDHIEVELGTPWQTLCDLAKKLGADLVVIGSHGYSALDRLIGTTAARVVNHAHGPVLVVREAR